jgi:hypothetical protein
MIMGIFLWQGLRDRLKAFFSMDPWLGRIFLETPGFLYLDKRIFKKFISVN